MSSNRLNPLDSSVPPIDWAWCRFDDLGLRGLYEVMAIRQRVFILEQGPYLDADGLDDRAWHLLGRARSNAGGSAGGGAGDGEGGGELLAYLRLVDPGLKYAEPSIGRVVTDASVRRTGLGRRLLAEAVAGHDRLWPGHGNRISAQSHLQDFYAAFGFRTVSAAPYLEDNIPHVEMWRVPGAGSAPSA
jgi:ElaA protein